jgi:hypothetical protein
MDEQQSIFSYEDFLTRLFALFPLSLSAQHIQQFTGDACGDVAGDDREQRIGTDHLLKLRLPGPSRWHDGAFAVGLFLEAHAPPRQTILNLDATKGWHFSSIIFRRSNGHHRALGVFRSR